MKKETLKAKRNNSLYLPGLGTNGNKKLVNNEHTSFYTWNIPAIKTCPYATDHCTNCCYAIKAERAYPSARANRHRNYIDSLNGDFTNRMIYTLETEINSKRDANKQIIVRIHESGDFYNQEYYKSWVEIANHFKDEKRVKFVAYTKSVKFLVGIEKPENLIIRYSIWDDTSENDIELAEMLDLPIYTAVDDFNNWSGAKCRCKDCATCGMCWNSNVKKIACEIH